MAESSLQVRALWFSERRLSAHPPKKRAGVEAADVNKITDFGLSLQDRLRDHAKAFDGLLSLIPAKMYYGEDTSVRLPLNSRFESHFFTPCNTTFPFERGMTPKILTHL